MGSQLFHLGVFLVKLLQEDVASLIQLVEVLLVLLLVILQMVLLLALILARLLTMILHLEVPFPILFIHL